MLAWFKIGLHREAIRLAKKYQRQQNSELLILNGPKDQSAHDGQETVMIDTIAAMADVSGEAEETLFIREALTLLTPRQREVVKATILDGFTEQETARRLEMSQSAVHKVKKRALNKLRKYLSF